MKNENKNKNKEGVQGGKQGKSALKEAIKKHIDNVLRQQISENSKMFELDQDGKIKAKDEQITCILDPSQYISDFSTLPNIQFEGHKLVKEVKNICGYDKNIEIIDLKLNVVGPNEDLYYSSFPFLVQNVRRGNTIIKVFNQEDSTTKYYIGRKGLMKFFDMRLNYISKLERNCLNLNQNEVKHHQEKNYIMAPVLKAIAQGHQVEVLKTLKANGENVQVAYSAETASWVITSKNVAILVRNREDIAIYRDSEDKDRYRFAMEMAEVWFNKLDTMTEKIKEQLRKELNGITMVGEYIGSQEHQHLVKYSRVTIIFYAIIDNYSYESCLPCSQAWKFFQRYGLDVVHIKSIGTFDNYGVLCDQLEKTFKDVAKSSIAQDEEGNVLYFIKKDKETGTESTLSLSKLKTLEYRLFRKMREKLRGFYKLEKDGTIDLAKKDKSKFDLLSKKFENESTEFLEGGQNTLPKPLGHYVSIFKAAYGFIEANPDQVNVLQNEYVTFSENLLDYISKKDGEEKIDTSSFFFSGVLDEQEQITFGKEKDVEMKNEEEKE